MPVTVQVAPSRAILRRKQAVTVWPVDVAAVVVTVDDKGIVAMLPGIGRRHVSWDQLERFIRHGEISVSRWGVVVDGCLVMTLVSRIDAVTESITHRANGSRAEVIEIPLTD